MAGEPTAETAPAPLHAIIAAVAPNLIFVLLVGVNCVRVFRHAMWLDETQAFMLAAASRTPVDLFEKLHYEGHPGLWHLLLWVITRFTANPVWMQVAHLLIALGIWLLIWLASPFKPYEKLLLLLSYFLFFEYFVVSRSYALAVLLAFGFVVVWLRRPEGRVWPFVLLGLLANTIVFGLIWSFGLCALYLVENRTDWRRLLPGLAVYSGLVALAIATMLPAEDIRLYVPAEPDFALSQLNVPVNYVVGAFLPLYFPDYIEARSVRLFLQGAPLVVLAIVSLPILACMTIVKDRLLVASYAVTVIGIVVFAELWGLFGAARHHGFLFVALVATVWLWRARPDARLAWLWIVMLAANALAGLWTLTWEAQPFSNSRNAAAWLEREGLEHEFVIGSSDQRVASISAYLEAPIYYLECECSGTYLTWNAARKSRLTLDEFMVRLKRGLDASKSGSAILITTRYRQLDEREAAPELAFSRLKRFKGARTDENYEIYRVTKRDIGTE